MQRNVWKWWILVGLLLAAGRTWAVLEVTVTEGISGAIPIAIAPFSVPGMGSPEVDVAGILASNLSRSGQFQVVPRAQYPAVPEDPGTVLVESWSALGAEYLVTGRLHAEGESVVIEFHLFDVLANQRLRAFRMPVPRSLLRRGAHRVSDMIYEEITGEKGAFSARIAYVSVLEVEGRRRYNLEVADSDGANPQILFRSEQPLMSPSWSPDGRHIAYVSFENRRSEIFRQNIETGERSSLSFSSGINSAPAWSPDGRSIAMSLSRDGHPNLYLLDLATQQMTQLTHTSSIDTEPAWSPDGEMLYFTSDRSGSPQIYRMNLRSGSTQRLTFEASSAGAVAVAPNGRSIVYVQGGNGGLRIAMLDLESRAVRLLTNGRFDKSPSFAPNGSIVLYSTTDRGRGILGSVSRDGRVHNRLAAMAGEVREPQWSP